MIGVPNFMTFWHMIPEILIFSLDMSSDDVTKSIGNLIDFKNLTARRAYVGHEIYFNVIVSSERSQTN